MNQYHAVDRYPTRRGCDGIEKCASCLKRVAATVEKLESPEGATTVFALPFHALFLWSDGTFTTLPNLDPSLN